MTTYTSKLIDAACLGNPQQMLDALTDPEEKKNIPEAYLMALNVDDRECVTILSNLVPVESLDQLDFRGWNPLFVAVARDNLEATTFLLARGMNVDTICDGQTVLHVAIEHCCKQALFDKLLSCHPDLKIRDRNGLTPADLALKCRQYTMFTAMVERGASYLMEDVQKIFQLAIRQRCRKTIKILMNYVTSHHLFIRDLLTREFEKEVIQCYIKMDEVYRQLFLYDAIRGKASIQLIKSLLNHDGHLTDMMLLTAVEHRSNAFIGFLMAMGRNRLEML